LAIETPRARYQQVADLLREAIERGDYEPGQPLPSQPELARQYGLNQTTINRAIAVLRNAGLVRVEQGRGAFVQELPTVRRIRRIPQGPNRDSTFAAEVERLGLTPKTDLVETRLGTAPSEVTERLGIGDGDQVLIRRRHMYAATRPVQLATSYIPADIVGDPAIADPDTNPTRLYERLAARGHQAARVVEEVEVRRPTRDEAHFLEIPEGQPVIVVYRTTHERSGRAIDAAVNVLTGYQWRLIYEWDVQPGGNTP
jgi:GntR family transcriptional regulator